MSTDEIVGIVDCGLGNVGSVENMCRKLGLLPERLTTAADVRKAQRIILPGVGSFDSGMSRLEPLVDELNFAAMEKRVPILGICLGAQLMTRSSDEGELAGLGWIAADTKRFDVRSYQIKVPHIGWNWVEPLQPHYLTEGLAERSRFYFVHSYHFVCDELRTALFSTTYGYSFVSGFVEGNIAGVQFHPEKSHRFGMALLQQFGQWSPTAQDCESQPRSFAAN